MGKLVNVLYRRTLTPATGRYALTVRVLNLLDAKDGSVSIRSFQQRRSFPGGDPAERESLRRVLTGIHISF
jgi:hypothetical protein